MSSVVVNGAETGSVYILTKQKNQFSSQFTFSTPLELQASDSKSTNGSVTHAVISLIIEPDMSSLRHCL